MQSSPSLVALTALALLISAPVGQQAHGQAPSSSPSQGESESPLSIFTDTTEVHVVNLDVVVTDRDGRPIRGLTPADFELKENGRPVAIDHFLAVEGGEPVHLQGSVTALGGSAPEAAAEGEGQAPDAAGEGPAAEPEPLHLVLFVDQVSLSKPVRDRALTHLREVLDSSFAGLREGDDRARVMVVTNDREINVRQGFTADVDRIDRVLVDLESTQTAGFGADAELRSLVRTIGDINSDRGNSAVQVKRPGEALGGAFGAVDPSNPDTFNNQEPAIGDPRQREISQVQAQARSVMPQIIGYSERRQVEVRGTVDVLGRFLDSLAGLPGRKALLYVSGGLSMNPAQALIEAFEARIAGVDDLGRQSVLAREIERFDNTALFGELAERASAGGVTFYAVDASPPGILSRGSAATTPGSGQGNEARFDGQFDRYEERNRHDGLQLVAEETGGRASLASADLDLALKSFFDDLENHYSLGYEVNGYRPDETRELEVELTRSARRRLGRGIQVRHRRHVQDRTEEQRMSDRTLSALVMDVYENPLDIQVTTAEETPAENGNFAVPVEIRVPLGRLVLLPGESMHQAQVDVYVAVQDDRGRTSAVARQLCPIRIPNEELLVALGRDAGCGIRLLMRPGKQRIAVGVHDRIAARKSTVAVDVAVGEPAGASVGEEIGEAGAAEAPGAR